MSPAMAETKPTSGALKDYLDGGAVRRLGEQVRAVCPEFALERFIAAAASGLDALEFTARSRHIAAALRARLPKDEKRALRVVEASLPAPLDSAEGMLAQRFWLWPVSDLVVASGPPHWRECMQICYRLTQCFTAEFAIRPLLEAEPEKTLARLLEWSADPNEHVRRLCSEGPRPRLPWASRLELPREQVLPILTALRSDPSRYVQKSVANHLNDLGKADPAWLLALMRDWQRIDTAATRWIVRHALRSLVAAGDPVALEILGYAAPAVAAAKLVVKPARVTIGGSLQAVLRFDNDAASAQRLLLDWVMHYARPGGTSRKVFKGTAIKLAAGEHGEWRKNFALVPRTTRALHPGIHVLEARVNGHVIARAEFRLRA